VESPAVPDAAGPAETTRVPDAAAFAAEGVSGELATPEAPARPEAAALALRFLGAASIVVLDLWSKASVFAWLGRLRIEGGLVWDAHGHPRYPLADGWLTFMLSRNPGAAFGQLESFPWFLVLGRSAAAVFLIWLLVRLPRGRPWFTAALVLVLGGALGNLYDNLFLGVPGDGRPFGMVRDFIDVYFGAFDWHFPTFNVADSCITVGAFLLLLSSLRGEKIDKRARGA
jgi:signal peptidase II